MKSLGGLDCLVQWANPNGRPRAVMGSRGSNWHCGNAHQHRKPVCTSKAISADRTSPATCADQHQQSVGASPDRTVSHTWSVKSAMAIVSLTAMSQESAVGIYVATRHGPGRERPPQREAAPLYCSDRPPADGLDNTSAVVTSGFIAEHPYRIHRCAQW